MNPNHMTDTTSRDAIKPLAESPGLPFRLR
jgi:hypothetical protein